MGCSSRSPPRRATAKRVHRELEIEKRWNVPSPGLLKLCGGPRRGPQIPGVSWSRRAEYPSWRAARPAAYSAIASLAGWADIQFTRRRTITPPSPVNFHLGWALSKRPLAHFSDDFPHNERARIWSGRCNVRSGGVQTQLLRSDAVEWPIRRKKPRDSNQIRLIRIDSVLFSLYFLQCKQ